MRNDAGKVRKQERYTVDLVTGCWIWNLHVTKYGYGWLTYKRKTMHAHRREYEKRHGAIPENAMLDHKCRNRRCVNPDHLEIVTNTENVRRGSTAKLTLESVELIRKKVSSGEISQKELATIYGVCPTVISKIVNGHAWVDEVSFPELTIKKKTSQYRGVSWHKAAEKWAAFVCVDRKSKHLGLYVSEVEAARAYNDAVINLRLSIPLNSLD